MSKLGYTVREAAKVAGVKEREIVDAVKAHELVAREVGGRSVLLRCDLKAWLKTLPSYLN